MNKKVLITGATGFAGSWLVDYLIKNTKDLIFGTYFSEKSLVNLGENKDKIEALQVDLRQEGEVNKLILDVMPDSVYHLAALTSASKSFGSPNETVVNNISSQLNLLESLNKNNLKNTKILIVSSAEVYGDVASENLPIDEDTPLNPTNPYAVSKLAQDFFAKQYNLTYGLKTIIVRPFNHIGPRQSPDFAVAAFAKKIAEIEKGKREPILTVGNLEGKRDFTDVRDMVKAYALVLEKATPGEIYNIGSGKSHKISEILNKLLSLSDKKITVQKDESLLRPIDNPELVCNPEKIKKLTNWEPEVPLDKTLLDTLDYWRNLI